MRIRYRELECFKKVEKGWINSIPDIWNCANLGYFCEFIMGQAPHSDTYNTIGEGTIFIKAGDFGKKYPKVTNYTINPLVQCKKGDILICVVGATSGKINFAIDGSISRSVAALRVKKELDKRYLYYFLDYSYQNINDLANGSAQGIINKDILKNIVIPLPNKETQQKISNFLDKKTAQFDSIISKKEALIEKLEEAKKSLISEVVTGKVKVVKTDDGYKLVERKKEEMKDSGVEWLGDIPKEWDIKKVKHVLSEPLKYGANESAELDDRSLPRYIRITDFAENGKLKDETFKSLTIDKASGYYLNEGDILFARSGATVGKTFLFKNYKGKACFAGYLIKASVNKQIINPEFLYNFTKSKGYENWKNSIFMQATIQNIGADKYKELKFTLPNKNEQEIICEFIEDKNIKYNKFFNKINKQIEKLKEAKQSLISEAVTGKIEILD